MVARALTVVWLVAGGLAVGNASDSRRAPHEAPSLRPAWSEVAWPFPRDAWPTGRAFRCPASGCGTEVSVYLRPKVGFCNCATGVADDDEIDRVGDLVVLGEQYGPVAKGRAITVGTMPGRARSFAIGDLARPDVHAVGIAFAKKCDAMAGMIVSSKPLPAAAERAAFEFLNGRSVTDWAEAAIGL